MTDPKIYAQALFEAISEVSAKDHDKVLDNFVKILSQNGEISLYAQIEKEYQKISGASKGIKQVEVTTASDIDSKELVHALNKVIGGKAELQHKIDKNLIGGVVIRADETLIDASIKNSLEKLRRTIIS
jgi:F-type H+-transporting ATPase subunit delta